MRKKLVSQMTFSKIAELSDSVTGGPDSSIYISQDLHFTDWCLCTCCHEINITKSQWSDIQRFKI